MDKQTLIDGIIAQLTVRYEVLARASAAARDEATHGDSKAESKYDTRGLEAGYLANGQAMQAEEIALSIESLQVMDLREYAPTDPIGIGALVEVTFSGLPEWYFLGPSTAGTDVEIDGKKITVISMEAPLTRQLVGKRQGERANPAAIIRTVR